MTETWKCHLLIWYANIKLKNVKNLLIISRTRVVSFSCRRLFVFPEVAWIVFLYPVRHLPANRTVESEMSHVFAEQKGWWTRLHAFSKQTDILNKCMQRKGTILLCCVRQLEWWWRLRAKFDERSMRRHEWNEHNRKADWERKKTIFKDNKKHKAEHKDTVKHLLLEMEWEV